jgi:hypothetical protein
LADKRCNACRPVEGADPREEILLRIRAYSPTNPPIFPRPRPVSTIAPCSLGRSIINATTREKKTVKKKAAHLAVVDPERHRASEKRFKDEEQREPEDEKFKLTRAEIRLRVKEIRAHLEEFSTITAGLHFDIIQPEEPYSLQSREDNMESSALAERLIPLIERRYKCLQKHLYDTSEWDFAEGVLGPMKWALADASFAIGVLAGAIFTTADPQQIDRLERGLCHAIAARPDCKD